MLKSLSNQSSKKAPSSLCLTGISAVLATGLFSAKRSEAASYSYDFGTSTGTYTTNAISTTFLPAPAGGGGTAMVRVGSGSGSLSLDNPGNAALGSGSELALTAPTGASVNKFSVYDFSSATSLSTLSLSAYVSGTAGTLTLATGNGTSFSNANAFTGADTFALLRFSLSGGTITTTYRSGGTQVSTGLTTTGFVPNTVLGMQFVQNNSASQAVYNYNGNSVTVAANSFDLYLNGVLVGDDLAKAQLATGTAIDSFMVYGETSSANNTSIRLDDINYSTDAQPSPAPEPMTASLLCLGAGAVLQGRRRKL